MEFSFQLYGARNFPPVLDILPTLKELGYAQVEGYGGLYANAPDLAQKLKDNGLTMPTGHFGLDALKDTEASMRLASDLGVKTLLCPAVPQDQRNQGDDGWKALSETLAKLGETFNASGFKFGWHNHAFEFAPTSSGAMPLDLIFEGAPDIVWQHDIAWTTRGGQDPIKWIDKYADRMVSAHVKDIAPEGECLDEDGWADVGHGTMDWQGLFNAIKAKTSCQSFVMEHDNPSDVKRFAERSIAAARKFGG